VADDPYPCERRQPCYRLRPLDEWCRTCLLGAFFTACDMQHPTRVADPDHVARYEPGVLRWLDQEQRKRELRTE
jgi:hypothetical protein